MQRILVIRRDNIGDLICTTPLIRAFARQLPDAQVDALVTDYNGAILSGNPDLRKVFSYQKAKHRGDDGLAGVYWRRLSTILKLRAENYDLALLPGGDQASALRFARLAGARDILVRQDSCRPQHEVEHCCSLLSDLGLQYETPNLVMVPPERNADSRISVNTPVVGFHISARKANQRWPAERFVEFAHRLHEAEGAVLLLFWAPGNGDNPLHPGDNDKANFILSQCKTLPLHPVATNTLSELISGLSRCDSVICSDGGAMHIAAGLSKPIVCFFGNSDPVRWHPWGVPYELLQPEEKNVAAISVEDAFSAYLRLHAKQRVPMPRG